MIRPSIERVLLCAGIQFLSRQERAQPLKLFFTDQSRVSTSAGAENSVVQIIGEQWAVTSEQNGLRPNLPLVELLDQQELQTPVSY